MPIKATFGQRVSSAQAAIDNHQARRAKANQDVAYQRDATKYSGWLEESQEVLETTINDALKYYYEHAEEQSRRFLQGPMPSTRQFDDEANSKSKYMREVADMFGVNREDLLRAILLGNVQGSRKTAAVRCLFYAEWSTGAYEGTHPFAFHVEANSEEEAVELAKLHGMSEWAMQFPGGGVTSYGSLSDPEWQEYDTDNNGKPILRAEAYLQTANQARANDYVLFLWTGPHQVVEASKVADRPRSPEPMPDVQVGDAVLDVETAEGIYHVPLSTVFDHEPQRTKVTDQWGETTVWARKQAVLGPFWIVEGSWVNQADYSHGEFVRIINADSALDAVKRIMARMNAELSTDMKWKPNDVYDASWLGFYGDAIYKLIPLEIPYDTIEEAQAADPAAVYGKKADFNGKVYEGMILSLTGEGSMSLATCDEQGNRDGGDHTWNDRGTLLRVLTIIEDPNGQTYAVVLVSGGIYGLLSLDRGGLVRPYMFTKVDEAGGAAMLSFGKMAATHTANLKTATDYSVPQTQGGFWAIIPTSKGKEIFHGSECWAFFDGKYRNPKTHGEYGHWTKGQVKEPDRSVDLVQGWCTWIPEQMNWVGPFVTDVEAKSATGPKESWDESSSFSETDSTGMFEE